jgi:hypothetical protein
MEVAETVFEDRGATEVIGGATDENGHERIVAIFLFKLVAESYNLVAESGSARGPVTLAVFKTVDRYL